MHHSWYWKLGWAIGVIVALNEPGLARPIADETLGNERSVVTEDIIRNTPSDRIAGGATRGRNLFHSFREFNVETGRGAYFDNPAGIDNIFSRVTGGNPSQIDGRLGIIQAGSRETLGNANLFFINPNGIIFGQNGSLDVGGSFVGTTANALRFGNQGNFSATSPETPALLTVNPSAFLFNQLPVGSIINNSTAPTGVNNLGATQSGLRVPDGESFLLVGGDISMDGGRINALGGRIELSGLSGIGRIDLAPIDGGFRLSLPANSPLSNILLTNNAFVNTAGITGGEIVVDSNILSLTNGGQLATATAGTGNGGNITVNANQVNFLGTGTAGADGITPSSGLFSFALSSGNAGDIIIRANQIKLENGGQIFASSAGSGQAGSIVITADTIELIGVSIDGRIRSGFASEAANAGNAGNISISTRQLNIENGATISSSTFGTGQAGNLTVNARESINLAGTGITIGRQIGSNLVTNSSGDGNAGILTVNTRQLTLQNGGTISASTAGSGQGGIVNINADTIEISSALVNGQLQQSSIGNIATGVGDGGDINILTRRLALRDGGGITTDTSGQGQGGDITVTARESIDLRGGLLLPDGNFQNSALLTGTTESGDAGRLVLNTRQLLLQDRAQISAATSSTGRGGNIDITANSIELFGIQGSAIRTGINNETSASANGGRAGDVTLNVDQLKLTNGALVSTSTSGSGQGGNLSINAGVVSLIEEASLSTASSIAGNAGSLTVNADRLSVRSGARILASTVGEGQGGNINIAADRIELVGASANRQQISTIASGTAGNGATGSAGDVTISARHLSIRNGAVISTDTANQGRGGNLRINAEDTVVVDGSTTISTGQIIASGISAGTRASGHAGNIRLDTQRLWMQNGGFISASTSGSGRAGNIRIDADSIDLGQQTENSQLATGISSIVFPNASGNAGNIQIEARELHVGNRAIIAASTQGQGDGGNIFIQLDEDFKLNQGFVTSGIFAGSTGNSGNINISARSLTARGGSQIAAIVSRPGRDQQGNQLPGGRGEGGNIQVTADSIRLFGTNRRGFSSGLLALSERGANGDAGDITVRTSDFRVADGAIVVASTFNRGDGGDIRINADRFEAVNGGQVVTNTRNRGKAGTITLNVNHNLFLSGADPTYPERRERARQYTERPGITDRISDVIVNQGRFSGLFANTGSQSSGDGGTINLNADDLSLRERATISARSQGEGIAGDIRLDVDNGLDITNSDITTSAQSASGGSINIASERIRLRGDSDIRTEVASDVGNGGDITLTTDSIVAFDDSDILAFAGEQGGDITFDTPAVFFEGGRQAVTASASDAANLDRNAQVNVNADGAVAGAITLPDVSFIENSLSDLPATAIDTDQLLANSCIARTETGGTFLITGSGALPAAPGNDSASTYPTGEVRVIPEGNESEWQPGEPIVEPQGVYRLPDGRLVMSRECESPSR